MSEKKWTPMRLFESDLSYYKSWAVNVSEVCGWNLLLPVSDQDVGLHADGLTDSCKSGRWSVYNALSIALWLLKRRRSTVEGRKNHLKYAVF